VTQPPIATGICKPLYIHGYFPPAITLDDKLVINNLSDIGNITLGQIVTVGCVGQTNLIENFAGGGSTDPVDIGQCYDHVLIFR